MTFSHRLLGISNAIVDILAHVEPEFIDALGAPAGSMTLIEADEARALYAKLGPTIEMSGGSVGNSVALFAQLGGTAAYIGRVADDQFGEVFTHDMRSIGVDTRLPPETRHAPTARSHVLITPDGQRTMQTYLGACTELEPDDIDSQTVGSPEVVLVEGYLFDTPHGPAAIDKLIRELPTESRVALSLSDSFCVERHLQTFQRLIGSSITIAIGNETEFHALFGTDSVDAALASAADVGALCVITRSGEGASVVDGELSISAPAESVETVIDTTGAGDAFAGGFLYEWTRSHDNEAALRFAMRCGAVAIQQVGARLPKNRLPTP
ncbi:MAG: adenosine kinase [Pseudomonadota bacterium]